MPDHGSIRCPTCGHVVVDQGAKFCPHDGTPLLGGAPWRDPLIGAVIDGRYRILVRVGEGGFAIVYHARHERLGIDVAVKVLRPELAHDRHVVARFAREARETSRIDHDNVVRVMDFGCAGRDMHYFVTEYVAGTPLVVELAGQAGLPPLRVAHITAQVAAGVGRAHALGIVHRDLKPDNVMLTRRGADADFAKVLDFGIAAAPHAQRLTKPGDILGTPHYMAPEQWSGGPIDERADIYALGAMVYEMLTGRPPFEGPTALSLLTKHLNDPPPLPTASLPSLRAGAVFDELVGRSLAKRPTDRFASMDEVLAVLGRIMSEVGRRSGRLTYSKTAAAAKRADSIPDATVYQSSPIDVVWDGATLCDEIRRLHLLRMRRLDELVLVLWPRGWPADAAALRSQAESIETEIEELSSGIALLEARLEEAWERGREEEARLRLAVIDANLRMAAALDRLPEQVLTDAGVKLPERRSAPPPTSEEIALADEWETERLPRRGSAAQRSLTDTTPDGEAVEDPTEPLRRADHRLASHHRRQQRDEQMIREKIAAGVGRLGALEKRVAPIYEKLAAVVRRESARRPDLRPAVVAFAQIDGALAAYQALLDALETGD
jgi:hypothetical protein